MAAKLIQLDVLHSTNADDHLHVRELGDIVDGDVCLDLHNRMLYATDASMYQILPLAVVIPKHIDDVIKTVKFCQARAIPILPRGAGTSLAGQAVNEAVIIDCSVACNHLLAFDESNSTCTVEPGIVLDQLNQELSCRSNGSLWFGPDVATSNRATIGGMIGNNSAGARSIMYGRTHEHIIEAKVIMPDGDVLAFSKGAAADSPRVRALTIDIADIILPIANVIHRFYPDITRSEGGYGLDRLLDQFECSSPNTFDAVNLSTLIAGSEGTLATLLESTLRLVPKPVHTGLAVIGFASMDDAVQAVPQILQQTHPSAVELLDDVIINLAKMNLEYRRLVDVIPQPKAGTLEAVLYVECFAECYDELHVHFDVLRNILPNHPMECHTAKDALERAWKLRKAAEPLVHAIPGHRRPIGFVEDTAVDPARLPEFVRAFKAIVQKHGTTASYYAHASVGCLHIRPLLNLRDPLDRHAMEAIARDVASLTQEFGGSFSGEHGIGRARGAIFNAMLPPELVAATQAIKRLFDPNNIMNPGNLINPDRIVDRLRIQPLDTPATIPEVDTFFEYDEEGGFAHAIELCNGAAACRSRDVAGTMCPSYKATLDERHSTRGRGNALRLAITGQLQESTRILDQPQWNDQDTLDTLDQCLSCKACKSECPSNVDVARYKAEYIAQSFREVRHVPFRNRVLARVHLWNQIGSTFCDATNILQNLPPLRKFINRVLGMSHHRSLPSFAPSFVKWFDHYTQPIASASPTVVLYADCFLNYNEPAIGKAVVRALNAFGYRVVVPRIPCCGRPAMSQGVLDYAHAQVRRAIPALENAIEQYQPRAILVCEPSCLSAVRDDWINLKIDGVSKVRRERIADIARLPEEFLEEQWDVHPVHPLLTARDSESGSRVHRVVALHGHCHQKALWSTDTTVRLLRRIACPENVAVKSLNTGCCGMAGAFGYDANQYELSMQIGEQSLFPAARALHDLSDVLLAPGTSCRQQIRDGVHMNALHPIQWIAQHCSGKDEVR